jgi:hypothetical protein
VVVLLELRSDQPARYRNALLRKRRRPGARRLQVVPSSGLVSMEWETCLSAGAEGPNRVPDVSCRACARGADDAGSWLQAFEMPPGAYSRRITAPGADPNVRVENQRGRYSMSDSSQPATERMENLRLAYQQTCASHDAITDFRAKLLALLPIASGAAGIFLLLEGDRLPKPERLQAIGLFGCAITLGLFIYEYRGIKTCIELRTYAGGLEERLGVPEGMRQFKDGGQPLRGPLAVEGASWVVYMSVFVGWLYLAGVNSWWDSGLQWIPPAFGVFLLISKFVLLRGAEDEPDEQVAGGRAQEGVEGELGKGAQASPVGDRLAREPNGRAEVDRRSS